MPVHVCHFPPGTSKWNKIEHRMFCHITQNWRGRPLVRVDDHTARWAPAFRALPLDRHGERRPTLSIDGRRVRSCAQSPCWADCTTSTRWRRQLRPCNTSRLAAEPFAIPAQPFKVSIPPQQTRFLWSTGLRNVRPMEVLDARLGSNNECIVTRGTDVLPGNALKAILRDVCPKTLKPFFKFLRWAERCEGRYVRPD